MKLQAARAAKVDLPFLLKEIAACRICVDAPTGTPLPHEPRPVLRARASAAICVSGQAPGTRVHATGLPFNDPSGDRLRDWMQFGRTQFYDERQVAIVPMGFCFPGQDKAGGDLPPRRECRANWHDRVFAGLPNLRLILAIGGYAQAYHLGAMATGGVTETVRRWREIGDETRATGRPLIVPLPHPSWRNSGWLKRHPWFETELLPALRAAIAEVMA